MQKLISLPVITLIDLTHTLTPEIPSWDGDTGFAIDTKLDYEDCDSEIKFRVQQIKMHAGIGTHMDAPAHCVPDGATIESIGIDKLFLPCIKIDISSKANASYSLTVADLENFEVNHGQCLAGTFVIVHTGWDQHWQTPARYQHNYIFPSISKEAAELLIARNVAGVGIDTLSPDRPSDGFIVHKLFLENNKIIIENIANATLLPVIGSYILAMPLKIKGATEAPVRLIAMVFERKC